MTKAEIRNQFNKKVYIFAESLGYNVEDWGDGSSVTFSKPNETKAANTIDYHRSHQDACILNYASPETKADYEKIEQFIQTLKNN